MKSINKVKSCIVGLGRIATLLEDDAKRTKPSSHAGAITSNPECKLVGGCDINTKRRKQFQNRWDCPVFDDCTKMLSVSKPDILHVCTPPETHLEFIKLGCQKKIPLIISEKPLAHNLETAQRICDIVNQSTTKVLVNHERRFTKDFNHVKQLIEEYKYGAIRSITGKLYFGYKRKLLNMLWDDGTHMIDVICSLTGDNEWEEIRSFGCSNERTGNLIVLSKVKDMDILLEIGAGRNYLQFEVDVSFESGRIQIGNGIYSEYTSQPSIMYENYNSLSKITIDFARIDYFSGMMQAAVDLIRKKSTLSPSSELHALQTIKIINQIEQSLG